MTGLYVHIPFCRSKCIYCDFYSTPASDKIDIVVGGLIREYEHRRREISGNFDTIYIGGGTPSIIPDASMIRLCNALKKGNVSEFTIEVNPEDVSEKKALLWSELGINRVSIGIQTVDDAILSSMGRRHTSSKALEALSILRQTGFTNISADLIYGLPGLSTESWSKSVEKLISMGVTHLSAYCLTVHEGTKLSKFVETGRIILPGEEDIEMQYNVLCRICRDNGFEHYEISNFAAAGFRSRHNSSYWNPDARWLGIGPSAHSYDGSTRRIDYPTIAKWLKELPAPYFIDYENSLDRINDNIVTALRTADGLNTALIPEDKRTLLFKEAHRHLDMGNLIFDAGRLSIPEEKWLISDAIIRDLIIVE